MAALGGEGRLQLTPERGEELVLEAFSPEVDAYFERVEPVLDAFEPLVDRLEPVVDRLEPAVETLVERREPQIDTLLEGVEVSFGGDVRPADWGEVLHQGCGRVGAEGLFEAEVE